MLATTGAVDHPDMIAYVTGNADPIHGSAAHAAMVQQMFHMFPDVHVDDPYPVRFASENWTGPSARWPGTSS